MLRNIIFDVAQVMVKYDPDAFMEERGYSVEKQSIIRSAVFDHPVWIDADRGTIEGEQLMQQFISNAPEYEDVIRDAWEHAEDTISKMSYAEGWVRDLKERGYQLYVLSNYGKDLHDRTVDKMTFLEYMDGILFSYQCHHIKPEWEIYQKLCDEYQLLPGESVFIDDNLNNVEAARKYGIHAIQFKSYEQAKKDLDNLLELYMDEDRMCMCAE